MKLCPHLLFEALGKTLVRVLILCNSKYHLKARYFERFTFFSYLVGNKLPIVRQVPVSAFHEA